MLYETDLQAQQRREENVVLPSPERLNNPRVSLWLAFFICSMVTLGSSIEAGSDWAVACSTITFMVTTTVVMLHGWAKTSVLIVGSKLEGFVVIFLCLFWTIQVAVVSDPSNDSAVDYRGGVAFGNLYYFSWGGLGVAVMLLASYLRSYFYIDFVTEYGARAPRLMMWTSLLCTTVLVMGSSAQVYDRNCTPTEGGLQPQPQPPTSPTSPLVYCERSLLGLALGAVGAILSIFVVGTKLAVGQRTAYLTEECVAGFVVCLSYAFGVVYITSEKGPGAPLGNLYYSTWASFFAAFTICLHCTNEWQEQKNNAAAVRRASSIFNDNNDIDGDDNNLLFPMNPLDHNNNNRRPSQQQHQQHPITKEEEKMMMEDEESEYNLTYND